MAKNKQDVEIVKGNMKAFVQETSVAAWERNGWTRADDGSSTEATNDPEPAAAEEESKKAPVKKTTTRKAQ